MLGGTEAFGKVWRLGANETTEIKLYQDITFGDKLIKAGTYSMFAIPDKTEWTIIFNSKLDTWGAFEYDQSKDVARVKVPAGNSESEVEAFTMIFDGKDATASLVIAWENTLVKVPLKCIPWADLTVWTYPSWGSMIYMPKLIPVPTTVVYIAHV